MYVYVSVVWRKQKGGGGRRGGHVSSLPHINRIVSKVPTLRKTMMNFRTNICTPIAKIPRKKSQERRRRYSRKMPCERPTYPRAPKSPFMIDASRSNLPPSTQSPTPGTDATSATAPHSTSAQVPIIPARAPHTASSLAHPPRTDGHAARAATSPVPPQQAMPSRLPVSLVPGRCSARNERVVLPYDRRAAQRVRG